MAAKFGMDGEILGAAPAAGRKLSGAAAIQEATALAMRRDPSIFVVGEGITDSGAVFGTTRGLLEEFGSRRVIESPLSEAAVTGICAGAALAGLRPLYVHQRVDFSLLGLDQLVNHAAKWSYMYDGRLRVPFVLRCIVGKGWGQAAQHSQSLQAFFAHVPGLRVVMPATAESAKGLLLTALEGTAPTVILESRAVLAEVAEVRGGHFTEPLGCAHVRRAGAQLTVVALSYLVPEALRAAELVKDELDVEVIDLQSVSPLDTDTIARSVRKTGRAIVLDTAWRSFGVSAEIAARIQEECFAELRAPVQRLALPDVPTPCSPALEKAYYPDGALIAQRMRAFLAPAAARRAPPPAPPPA